MKFIQHIVFGMITAASLLMASCSSGQEDVTPGPGEMTLRIAVDIPQGSTRAEDTESVVSDVAVMLFTPDAGSQPGTLYDCMAATNLTPRTGGYFFHVSINLNVADVPDKLVAVLLCNASAERVQAVKAMKGKSYALISAALNASFTVADCAKITMSGICSPLIDTSLASQQITASVVRDRARVDILAQAVDAGTFDLSEVYIYRHNDRVALLPSSAGTLTVPAEAVKVDKSMFSVTPVSNNVTAQVYIPEADVLMNGSGDVSDSNRLNRTAIVVGGHYNGSAAVNYYRIDFTDTDGRLTDVLRNHRYVVNITDVKGPGEPTPDDAYSSITAGVTATVLDWERNDQYIAFDGTHWFSVESRHLEVGPDSGNSALLALASDIPASEWRMGWSAAGVTDLPAVMTDAASLDGSVFRVIRPAGDVTAGDHLSFTALSALPDGMTQRSETLHILAGRLHVIITVTQCDLATDPWIDGGSIEYDN